MKRQFSHLTVFLLSGLLFTTIACDNSGTTETGADTTGTATDNSTNTAGGERQVAEATLSGVHPDTTVTGVARFEQMDNGRVKLNLDLTIPAKANQEVAVHIHEHSSCADHGDAAGGHWNPTGENHGRWGQGAYHSGDIGNVSLDGEGKGTIELETDRWSIGGDQQKNILDKAFMIHTGKDDYTTQPSGNAGKRIGCAIITRKSS